MSEVVVTTAAMRVVRLLVGRPPQTVSDLIKAAGVPRTAIMEQLNELVAAGFVNRSIEHLAGRGRPRYVYSATNAALVLLFADNQNLVVPAIWWAIEEIGGEELCQKVLDCASRAVASHYRRDITARKPEERLRQLVELLREEGVLIDLTEKDGRLTMSKRSCPFISMLDKRRSVCCLDQAIMTIVVGQKVLRTACRYEGAPCCQFELTEEGTTTEG